MVFRIATILMFSNSLLLANEIHTFGDGETSVEIEFVRVGDPGNLPDEPDSWGISPGAVDYGYEIAKFELSCGQSERVFPGIQRNCREFDDFPDGMSYVQATDLVNRLNLLAGYQSAYGVTLDPGDAGYNPDNPLRNSLAKYFLATGDEWYKAAYYDPVIDDYWDYATGTDENIFVREGTTEPLTFVVANPPVEVDQAGGLSPYGTMGQTGNTTEWEEYSVLPDGSFPRFFRARGSAPASESRQSRSDGGGHGIRIVAIEPMSQFLLADFDQNGEVDFADFLTLSGAFGDIVNSGTGADLNSNGEVDFPDFLLLSESYGQATRQASVPEASATALIFAALLSTAVGFRKSRRGR